MATSSSCPPPRTSADPYRQVFIVLVVSSRWCRVRADAREAKNALGSPNTHAWTPAVRGLTSADIHVLANS